MTETSAGRTPSAPDALPCGRPRFAGETWLGDLALALAALDVDVRDTHRTAQIAALLGLQLAPPSPTLPPQVPETEARPPVPTSTPPPVTPPVSNPQSVDHQEPARSGRSRRTTHREPLQLLQPLTITRPLPVKHSGPALPSRPQNPAAPAPKLPLMPPRSELATLQTVLSRVVPEGRVDIDRLLELVATGQPLVTLPRHPSRTLRFGAQVLVDVGPGMQLFAEDQAALISKIQAISGKHATNVLYFADAPLTQVGPGAGWTWRPYHPPAPGTQVIVLSNFSSHVPGVPAPAALRDEWRQLGALLQRGNCQPVALMPLPQSRWPSWVTDLMPVLSWDRSTSAACTYPRLP